MLAKFSSVDPKTNKYVKPASASLVYGTLVSILVPIIPESYSPCARRCLTGVNFLAIGFRLIIDLRRDMLTDQSCRLGSEAP